MFYPVSKRMRDLDTPSCRALRCSMLTGAVLLALLTPVTLGVDWDIEFVDDAFNWGAGSSIAIVVGDDGVPHIANGSTNPRIMRYAVKPGDEWLVEDVDVANSGLAASIALDPDGNPSLAYEKSGSLIFARLVGGSWVRETVDAVHFDSISALAFTSDGTPRIAYCKSGSPWNLRHAWKPAGTWETSDADTTLASGNDISMVLDDNGDPHIAHWAAPSGGSPPWNERYTSWDGETWNNDVVDSTVENCNVMKSGIALDSAGVKHIAFMSHDCGFMQSEIRYAVGDVGDWTVTAIEGGFGSAGCSLVLDRTGSPHIVYGTGFVVSGGSSQLRYAYLDSAGEWVVEVIDSGGDAGEINSLAIDPQGFLHVAYFRGPGSGQTGELRYARSTTPVGGGCSGDIDGDGDTDLGDLAELLAAYDTSAGDPLYNPDADFDDDGDVDLSDLAFLLADYGCGV